MGVCAMPSLTFLHCSYVDRFAKAIGADGERLKHLKLDWADPVTEIRYGDRKSYDPGISVAQDVVPHVWAILSQIARTPIQADGVKSCRIAAGGPQWAERSGPLSRQLQDFFSALNRRTAEPVAQALLGLVALAERCDALLKQRQRNWLARGRAEGDLHYALRDLLSPRFYEQAQAPPGDRHALEE
jgi:hypothetical protein